jgi:ubiquinone biosynthesis protein UbiJ
MGLPNPHEVRIAYLKRAARSINNTIQPSGKGAADQFIDEHRHRTADSGTVASLTDEIATLRGALDALADKVRRHDEQLRRLRAPKTDPLTGQRKRTCQISG